MSALLQDSTELFREPGTTRLSPNRVAKTLALDLSALADAIGVHRNTLRLHPDSAKTQEGLRELNRVFLALLEVKADELQTSFHMMNTPIRVLGQRTLFEAVRDGDVDKALRYIQTISGGQNG